LKAGTEEMSDVAEFRTLYFHVFRIRIRAPIIPAYASLQSSLLGNKLTKI
jgi:hypothetical protein